MDRKPLIIFTVVILLSIAAGWLYTKSAIQSGSPKKQEMTFVANASYLCRDGKTIEASFYKGPTVTPKPGEPPIPNGSVSLKLSDGRSLTVPQTISASGIRYANSDGSFIFWSKGNSALILENNSNQTYIGCVTLAKNPGDLPNTFVNQEGTFSIRYPAGYTINTSYLYQELGPGKDIAGVKFTIPKTLAEGTNLSSYDTGFSVEEIPQISDCNASPFLYPAENIKKETITDNNTEYSVMSETGAAAGNYYEEKVWALPGTNPCLAVRYFIHSTNIQNYPEGTVRAFDRDALIAQFDEMRRSLILAP